MARVHGKDGRVLVNEFHLSGDIKGWRCAHQRAYGDVTTIPDGGDRWIPGLISGELALSGVFDSDAGSLFNEANTQAGTDDGLLVTVMPAGLAIGGPALITMTDIESITVDAEIRDAVPLSIAAKPDAGVDMGLILHALGAETADGNGASADNDAATTNGGVASLHVTAYTGLTSAVIKVQHSEDDSVWEDLITFTSVTAVTSELKTVTGDVHQYVRASVDVTGTGSVTYAVAFARR